MAFFLLGWTYLRTCTRHIYTRSSEKLCPLHSDYSSSSHRLTVMAVLLGKGQTTFSPFVTRVVGHYSSLSRPDSLCSTVSQGIAGHQKSLEHKYSALEHEMRVMPPIYLTEVFENKSVFAITQTLSYSSFLDLSCLMRHDELQNPRNRAKIPPWPIKWLKFHLQKIMFDLPTNVFLYILFPVLPHPWHYSSLLTLSQARTRLSLCEPCRTLRFMQLWNSRQNTGFTINGNTKITQH